MSVDRKEIDLIIRAAVQGGKTLENVTKSIAEIERSLDAQTAAAKRGEASIDELKASLVALQRVQDQLKDQARLINQYERLSAQIEKSATKAEKATREYAEYQARIEKVGKATDAQRDKLVKLAAAVERNQAALTRQRTDQQALTSTLQDAGIAVDQLSSAETRARQAAAQLGVQINRTQQAISSYSDDVRKARENQRKFADEKVFQQKLQDAASMVKASEYVRFWTDALAKADIAEDQVRINTALRKLADEAIAAARGYKTLGTAAKSLAGTSGTLRSVIEGIVDPATQARQTLAGVETKMRDIGGAINSIRGPVENYKGQLKELNALQKAISGKAALVDSFNQQVVALRSARAEFTQARAQVLQYADALRNSNGTNEQLAQSLKTAQAALASSQSKLAQQIVSTRQVREAMREAGLATNNLAQTQSRLTNAAQSGANALKQLQSATQRYGQAVENANNSNDIFNNSGRTTLSFLQRMRGEVLSLVAAYAGLYGAISGAGKSIEAFNAKQGIQNQLALSAGNDNEKIAKEYEYIRKQADRIGISFEEAAKGYAKFSASATLAGRDAQEIKYIFETFAEVGRVANLSTDELDGVFKALGQIISKGSIQAEELRGQLGDRLFGAFEVAAQALKDQFPQLDKAMKEGKVTADQLIKIAEKYKETVGVRLSDATKNLSANQARLNSALFDFKVLVAEQGFAAEYGKLVDTLTRFFQSHDGAKFAKSLSDGLSAIVKILVWLVENAELVKQTLIVGVFIYGAKMVASFGLALAGLPSKIRDIQVASEGASKSVRAIQGAFAAVTAAAVGWEIGTILSEKFEGVRKAGVALVIGFHAGWTKLKYEAMILWEDLPLIFSNGMATLGNIMSAGIRDLLEIFAAGARSLGRTDLAESVDKAIGSIASKAPKISSASAKLRAEMKRELDQIREIGLEMWKEAERPGSTSADKNGGATATPKPDKVKPGRSTGDDEKEAEKRLRLKEQLENELTAIEAKIEKNEKDSLERRLNAIDLEYQKLLNKVRKFGGAESAAMESRLSQSIANLKQQEIRRFNDALYKEQTDLQKKLEDLEAKGDRSSKTDLDKRLEGIRVAYQDTYNEISDYRDRLLADKRDTTTADLMEKRLEAGVIALQNVERQKYYEDAVNVILDERKAKIESINTMEKAGLLTSIQARERAAEVINQTQPKIEAVTAEGLKYVDTMIAAAAATGDNVSALETLRAKLIEAQISAQGLRTELVSAAQINEMIAGGATTAFETMADSIGKAAVGMMTWKDAVLATRNAFLKFAADFLMEMGKMIAKKALLEATQGSSAGSWISKLINGMFGGGSSFASSGGGYIGAGLFHSGGVVGSGGKSIVAPAAWFSNAPRYHGGGLAGLAPNEYPAVLKRNEEVLTTNDPRNVLNGGASQAASQNLKIINMIDSGSVVSEGLATQSGEKAFFNFIRANRTGLRQILA